MDAISIHALHTEGDGSTRCRPEKPLNFNPRPPYGGRRGAAEPGGADGQFQSTPSIRRATTKCNGANIIMALFQSTPSIRRATRDTSPSSARPFYFNPRPPYGGRQLTFARRCVLFYFNPRPPYGGRQVMRLKGLLDPHFNPRPPYGGRPRGRSLMAPPSLISIHALHTEGDPSP